MIGASIAEKWVTNVRFWPSRRHTNRLLSRRPAQRTPLRILRNRQVLPVVVTPGCSAAVCDFHQALFDGARALWETKRHYESTPLVATSHSQGPICLLRAPGRSWERTLSFFFPSPRTRVLTTSVKLSPDSLARHPEPVVMCARPSPQREFSAVTLHAVFATEKPPPTTTMTSRSLSPHRDLLHSRLSLPNPSAQI